MPAMRSTTILAVRRNNRAAIGGDGQVTLGQVVMKGDAHKIRRLHGGAVLVGFAGSAADAFALMERFEAKLKDFQGSVPRAATELAKDWRTDRILRRLEAMMLAVDRKERIARISLVGPAERMPEILPLPASAEGSFDEGGLRVVWSEVPIGQAAVAAQGVHAALMASTSV